MALIHIKRDHNLTREQARARIGEVAETLGSEFKLEHTWDGNVMRFKRAGAKGAIAVGASAVEIKIKLNVALAPMKGRIEKAIVAKLDELEADA